MPRQFDSAPPPGCLYLPGAAEYLGYTVSALRRWRFDNVGPKSFLHGGLITYKIADLDEWKAAKAAQTERGGTLPGQPAAPGTGDTRPPESRRSKRAAPKSRTSAA